MGASLTWKQAAAWRFARHGLADRAQPPGALELVGRIGCLHAQVMSSAELSLHARVDGLDRDAVPRMLWEQRSLYKSWAMRGTLHLLPAAERALWQGALANYRWYEKPGWAKGFGVDPDQVRKLLATVAEVLHGALLTRAELAEAVAGRTGDPAVGELVMGSWGPFLKPSAYRGELCFGPSAGQQVRFTHPDTWLGRKAEPDDPDRALRDVVRRYLGAYGPATREDLSRWWAGLSPAAAGRMLAEVGVPVEVDGLPAYLLAEHVEEVAASEPTGTLRLLPAFDPYVAGAPRAGHGIFPAERRQEIYRQAGWLTPVIVRDGVIVGLFRYDNKGEIELSPWGKLPKRALQAEVDRFRAACVTKRT